MQYVGVQHIIDLINVTGIETVLSELTSYVEEDYKRWAEFDMQPRYASHHSEGVFELMPTRNNDYFTFKYVNGHPKNTKSGLQTVVAMGLLCDVDSGYPRMISEMTFLTALRTAATSAMAAKYLAPKNVHTMAMIGAGAQSEFQALAFKEIHGIKRLRIYDIEKEACTKFVRNMETKGFEISIHKTGAEAAIGADIITVCTADKQMSTVISDNMVSEGMHINAIGGDCPGKTELQADILHRGDVFVEFETQSRIEGEIQQMPEDFAVTELWQVVQGIKAGRKSTEQITIFDSVGVAVQDFSVLRYIYDKIQDTAFFEEIDLLTEPEDPRDLYGLLSQVSK